MEMIVHKITCLASKNYLQIFDEPQQSRPSLVNIKMSKFSYK